jgi:hypothetical protein
VRRRGPRDEEFLRRPEATWRRLSPHANPTAYNQLPGFAGAVLARRGELTAGEVERLQAIAAGGEEDEPPITAESARYILGRVTAA